MTQEQKDKIIRQAEEAARQAGRAEAARAIQMEEFARIADEVSWRRTAPT